MKVGQVNETDLIALADYVDVNSVVIGILLIFQLR